MAAPSGYPVISVISNLSFYLFIYILFSAMERIVIAPHVPRPKGVPLSKLPLYNAEEDFRCIDGSNVIPFQYVNDDYCDCADASDEPGTSACPHGHFHCTNAGYVPKYIPSARVNDGICDCCDASDEYDSDVICINNCKQLGQVRLREEKERQKKIEQGYQKRVEMSKSGTEKRKEYTDRRKDLEKQKEELLIKRNELEEIKKGVEEPEKLAKDEHYNKWQDEKKRIQTEKDQVEAEAAFRDIDADNDGVITPVELMKVAAFDVDKDGEVTEDELVTRFSDDATKDWDLETFTETLWYKMKFLYRSQKYKAPDADADKSTDEGGVDDEGSEPFTEAPEAPPPPNIDPVENLDDDDEYDRDDRDDDDEYRDDEDEFYDRDGDEDDAEFDGEGKKDEDLRAMPPYDKATQELIRVADEARKNFNEVDKQVKELETEMSSLSWYDSVDYGNDNEYLDMDKECFEYSDREYVYRLCLFDKVSQRPKGGGGETSLGSWEKWDGPEENKYSAMSFTNGVQCWNGPKRSAKVLVSCGVENELFSASEPSRCEYLLNFSTPAACSPSTQTSEFHNHDEL